MLHQVIVQPEALKAKDGALQLPGNAGCAPVALVGVLFPCVFGLLFLLLFFSSLRAFSAADCPAFASVNTAGGGGGVGAFSTFGLIGLEAVVSLCCFAFAAATSAASSSTLRFLTAAVEEVNLRLPGSPRMGFSSMYSSLKDMDI